MDVPKLIDQLTETLVSRELARPQGAREEDLRALDEIDGALAPLGLGLPSSLRSLWELLDARTLPDRVQPYPRFSTPEFSLSGWRMWLEELPCMLPPSLFPFAYESHGYLLIELDLEERKGGDVFSFFSEGAPFRRYLPSVEAWLELLVASLASENLGEGGNYRLSSEAFDRRAAERLTKEGRHPLYGERLEFECDPYVWPAHWLSPAGISPDQFVIRGATHTIADLLEEATETFARGRIHGAVTGVVSSQGSTTVDVSDETGSLRVAYSEGPGLFHSRTDAGYELDLIVIPESVTRRQEAARLRDSETIEDRGFARSSSVGRAPSARSLPGFVHWAANGGPSERQSYLFLALFGGT